MHGTMNLKFKPDTNSQAHTEAKSQIGNELVGQFPIIEYNSDVVLDLDLKSSERLF